MARKSRTKAAVKNREYIKKNPWAGHLYNARKRCRYKGHDSYIHYGGKGIKCYLTRKEIYDLWFRDKAYNLSRPSLDRRNSNKNYDVSNCRFIELIENTSAPHRKNQWEEGEPDYAKPGEGAPDFDEILNGD